MENKDKFVKDATVYVYEPYSGRVVRATLTESIDGGAYIDYKYTVNRNGSDDTYFGGSSARKLSDIWFTAEEAFKAIDDRNEEQFKIYYQEMKTLEDVLMFPLRHCLANGEEYIEYNAKRAYKERIKEILECSLAELEL